MGRPFQLFLLTAITAMAGCPDSFEVTYPQDLAFIIQVDSIQAPPLACSDESLSVKVWARIGPNACFQFVRFEQLLSDSGLDITAWGQQTLNSPCASGEVTLQGKELKIMPISSGPLRIRVHQPDSSVLLSTVEVGESSPFTRVFHPTIAVLLFDYRTHAFEGASVQQYYSCRNCSCVELPFIVRTITWGDDMWVRFLYEPTLEEVFFATIQWHGRGAIQQPNYFVPADSFALSADSLPQPRHIQRFDPYLELTGLDVVDLPARTDSVWSTASHLQFLRDFDSSTFRIGYYLYPPSVGLFGPSVAKWVVFAYGWLPFPQHRRLTSGSS